jgi:hypothetical protein
MPIGRERFKTMTLATSKFIRRLLIHVLPHGFHRIRHHGLFASGSRIATSRAPVNCSPLLNASDARRQKGGKRHEMPCHHNLEVSPQS